MSGRRDAEMKYSTKFSVPHFHSLRIDTLRRYISIWVIVLRIVTFQVLCPVPGDAMCNNKLSVSKRMACHIALTAV